MTAERFKQLLGWRIAEKDEEYLLVDLEGNKIVCTNNRNNRPFSRADADLIQQEVLRGNWECNMEPVIIGESGLVLSGQHRGVGCILAVQAWTADPEKYPFWETEPTMDICIGFGCSEADKVVNTIDTGKRRSLSDVLYRSPYFKDLKPTERRATAKVCEFAVRFLWKRTGVEHAMSLKRTHAESLDFIERHPRVVQCVRHICDEDGEAGQIHKYTKSLGAASGLMYLMAMSNSDLSTYDRTEASLDDSNFEKAEQFWIRIATRDKTFKLLDEAITSIVQSNGLNAERIAVISKTWLTFAAGKPLNAASVSLRYLEDGDGAKMLSECPTVGGIDIGDGEALDPDVTEDEVEDEKAVITKENQNKKALVNNQIVYVIDPNGGHWSGELLRTYKGLKGELASIKVGPKFAGAGKTVEVPLSQVQKGKP